MLTFDDVTKKHRSTKFRKFFENGWADMSGKYNKHNQYYQQ